MFVRRTLSLLASLLVAVSAAALLGVLVVQSLGWYRFTPILSGSMSPFVEAGDVAVLRPTAPQDVQPGHVIAFEAPTPDATLTLHRVVEVVSRTPLIVRTKGDANSAVDPWEARLQGDRVWRATSHVDHLGKPVLIVHRQRTRMLLFGFAVSLAVLLLLRRMRDRQEVAEARHRELAATVGITLSVAGIVFASSVSRTPAHAAMTGAVADATAISAEPAPPPTTDPPTNLTAALLCKLGVPTGVQLDWTQPVGQLAGYEIYRGASETGPFDVLVGTARPSAKSFTDPIESGANPLDFYYIVVAVHEDLQVDASNSVSLVSLCESVTPADPALEPEPVPTTVAPIATTVPTTVAPITTTVPTTVAPTTTVAPITTTVPTTVAPTTTIAPITTIVPTSIVAAL